jgi:carboxymethylenebutenolidase
MMRGTMRALAASLIVAFAASARAATVEKVDYPSGAEKVGGVLATPGTPGKHPALIVIHEWWGLNDWVKDKAKGFADQGYVALAVDLYRGKSALDADTAHQLMRGLPEDRAVRDLKAAFAYLAARPDVDAARIGSIGWCMGGGYSLAAALAEPKLAATVIYYGRLATDAAAIGKIKAPLLGNFGATDQGIPPDSVDQFAKTAKKAGVSVDFKVFPGCGHGFASAKSPPECAAAAKEADQRAADFLAKRLKKK